MKIIGITGGLASGKSTVSLMFQKLGAEILDADAIARRILEVGQPGYQAVIQAFGKAFLQSDNNLLNRAALAQLVFENPNARRALEQITHPLIEQSSQRTFATWQARGVSLVFYEAALLVETGRYQKFNGLIVVDVSPEVQVQRALQRGMSPEEVLLRINAQANREMRLQVATWVVDNNGSLHETETQVKRLWTQLTH